jgi:hypothetical protein
MLLHAAIPAGENPAAPAIPMIGAVTRAGAAKTAIPAPATTVVAVSMGFSQAALPSYLDKYVREPINSRVMDAVLTRRAAV